MDQIGERLIKLFAEMTWNQELDAVWKYAPESLLDEAITVVQKRFPDLKVRRVTPSMKKGKIQVKEGRWTNARTVEIDVPDGIIAHLTRECSGNVQDRHVVEVTSRFSSLSSTQRRSSPLRGRA
jgi:hypothetical protein